VRVAIVFAGMLVGGLLAGCHEPVLIVAVEANGNAVDGVELFLVDKLCSDCDPVAGMEPPGFDAPVPGPVYYTDGDVRVFARPAPGETETRFGLEPGDGADRLVRLIAVGFDAQGRPNSLVEGPSDFAIADSLGERWDLDLEARPIARPTIAPVDGTAPPSGGAPGRPRVLAVDIGDEDKLLLWRPPIAPGAADDRASCLMIAHDDGIEFVVPPDDADCDGIVAGECHRTWYQGFDPPDPSALCLDHPPQQPAQCRVGHLSTCIDGRGPGCLTGSYCVPDAACSTPSCKLPLEQNCSAALVNAIGITTIARLHCTIPIDETTHVPCHMAADLDANPLFPGCSNPGFFAFGSGLSDPPPTILNVPPAMYTIVPVANPCHFEIDVSGTLDNASPAVVGGFVVQGAAGDHMVIPFVVEAQAVPDCTTEMTTCGFAPSAGAQNTDHVWECAM
jgi:hypothetical protein